MDVSSAAQKSDWLEETADGLLNIQWEVHTALQDRLRLAEQVRRGVVVSHDESNGRPLTDLGRRKLWARLICATGDWYRSAVYQAALLADFRELRAAVPMESWGWFTKTVIYTDAGQRASRGDSVVLPGPDPRITHSCPNYRTELEHERDRALGYQRPPTDPSAERVKTAEAAKILGISDRQTRWLCAERVHRDVGRQIGRPSPPCFVTVRVIGGHRTIERAELEMLRRIADESVSQEEPQ